MEKRQELREKWEWKKIWKKYKTAIGIELVFLCVILCCGLFLYRIERNDQIRAAGETMEGIQDQIRMRINENKPLDTVAQEAMELIRDTADAHGNSAYALGLDLYNNAGFRARNIWPGQLTCTWRDGAGDGIETETFFLKDYFNEEAIDGFFDWYRQLSGEKTKNRIQIERMVGAYVNGRFKPAEVIFADNYAEDETYVLCNPYWTDGAGREKQGYEYRYGNLPEDTAQIPEKAKIGHFTACIYAEDFGGEAQVGDGKLEPGEGVELANGNLAESIVREENWIYYRQQTDANDQIGGYVCEVGADIGALIRSSGNLRRNMLPVFLFFQGVAILLIAVYLYIQRKQEKLQSMRNIFLNAIAHEMKTPASVIKSSAECLGGGIHPEKQEHYIEIIGQESDHMNELLNAMLTYTRITDTACLLQGEKCSLAKLAEDIRGRYNDAMEQKQISCIMDRGDSAQASVSCDVRLMEMVLDNFLSNAVKFCAPGGVIRITVQGTGVGVYNEGEPIPTEELPHVWEPLYRGDSSRSFEKGSSGMGLAISAAILDLHGADYGVRNVDGGVEFYFAL